MDFFLGIEVVDRKVEGPIQQVPHRCAGVLLERDKFSAEKVPTLGLSNIGRVCPPDTKSDIGDPPTPKIRVHLVPRQVC